MKVKYTSAFSFIDLFSLIRFGIWRGSPIWSTKHHNLSIARSYWHGR